MQTMEIGADNLVKHNLEVDRPCIAFGRRAVGPGPATSFWRLGGFIFRFLSTLALQAAEVLTWNSEGQLYLQVRRFALSLLRYTCCFEVTHVRTSGCRRFSQT